MVIGSSRRAPRGRSPLVAVEGIPPVEPYLSLRRRSPGDYAAQLTFGAILLERELYYTTLYRRHGPFGEEEPPAHSAAWLPYPPTAEGRAALRARRDLSLSAGALPPFDLFGLKAEALDGLRRTVRRTARQGLGVLLASVFSSDLGDHRGAFELASALLDARPRHRGALARAIGVVLPLVGEAPKLASRLRGLEQQARRAFGLRWMNALGRAQEAGEVQIRRVAWAIRSQVEGERFTRLLKTEWEFCAEEHERSLVGFDASRVPPRLRELIPLARRFGVGDDACRDWTLRRASASERSHALSTAGPFVREVQAWISTFAPAYPPEVAAFFWLLEALEQLQEGGR